MSVPRPGCAAFVVGNDAPLIGRTRCTRGRVATNVAAMRGLSSKVRMLCQKLF